MSDGDEAISIDCHALRARMTVNDIKILKAFVLGSYEIQRLFIVGFARRPVPARRGGSAKCRLRL